MPHRKTIPILLWGLTAFWFMMAWFLSSQTGEQTGTLSMAITKFIARIFHIGDASLPTLHSALRTSAHFVVFFVLNALACASSAVTFPKAKLSLLWPTLACCAFAVLDEARKAAIPGRHCSWSEAGLNVLGCLAGVAVVWMAVKTINRVRPNSIL